MYVDVKIETELMKIYKINANRDKCNEETN